ncbi:hypothetical protein KW469_00110 [Vibrio fluvialis]|nr:hypothetical protein [Vibrio fluvialis]
MPNKHLETLLKNNPNINVFRLFTFSFSNKVQDRIVDLSLCEKNIIEKSITYKNNNSTSFWEAFFTTSVKEKKLEQRIVKQAIHHNKNNEYIHVLSQDLLSFIQNNNYDNLAINSKVELECGSSKHIPMLDFKISTAPSNLKLVESVLSALGCEGAILDSGKSYHFVGSNLISQSELIELLAKFILFHPIADKAWAAHQIIEGSASLRVSNKYGKKPEIISYI